MSNEKIKIIFMGTPKFAADVLRFIIASDCFDILAVYTNKDEVRGRGNKTSPTPVKIVAHEYGIHVETPDNINDASVVKQIKDYKPQFICVAAYGQILKEEILNIPENCLNVHASLLPKWRGAAPVQRAILNGDSKIGVSIMKMDTGLDTGDYFHRKEPIYVEDYSLSQLYEKLAKIGADELQWVMTNINKLNWKKQDNQDYTIADKLDKRELWAKDNDNDQLFYRKIKASSKSTPAKCSIAGKVVTVLDAKLEDGKLQILKLKPDGKNEMDWKSFVAGIQDKSEENLKWRPVE